MDIIKTSIINLLFKFKVVKENYNYTSLLRTINFKKNFFTFIFAVYSKFQVFIEFTFLLVVQNIKLAENNILKLINFEFILNKSKFSKSVSFLLSPKIKEYEKVIS